MAASSTYTPDAFSRFFPNVTMTPAPSVPTSLSDFGPGSPFGRTPPAGFTPTSPSWAPPTWADVGRLGTPSFGGGSGTGAGSSPSVAPMDNPANIFPPGGSWGNPLAIGVTPGSGDYGGGSDTGTPSGASGAGSATGAGSSGSSLTIDPTDPNYVGPGGGGPGLDPHGSPIGPDTAVTLGGGGSGAGGDYGGAGTTGDPGFSASTDPLTGFSLPGTGGMSGGTGGITGPSGTDWWSTFTTLVSNLFQRAGIVLLGIILLGAAAWGMSKNDGVMKTVHKMV